MHIINWLLENNMTQQEFAKTLGVSHPAVTYWCQGLTRPSARHAEMITRLTRNEVTANDFQRAWEKRQ